MPYSIKTIYYTLQGEGAQVGRASVFLRFAGCNLWSGREEDRAAARCSFCDTDFIRTDGPGGGKFEHAASLARAVHAHWPPDAPTTARPYVVCTGGEPLLQLDDAAVRALHAEGFEVAVETNGTCAPPADIDWLCVSPKAGVPLELARGDELKLVYPQAGLDPQQFTHLEFDHFFLQPMDNAQQAANIQAAVQYCLKHPQWRLSLQTHKLLGLP